MRTLLLVPLSFLFVGCIGIGTVVSDKRTYETKSLTTKEDILAKKGEPYKKITNGDREDWFYKRELAWGGIVPQFFLIPIPLLLPYGYRNTVINFEKNTQISEEFEYGRAPTILCGPLVPMIHGAQGDDFCSIFPNYRFN